jgi:hypothetical protein
MGDRIDTCLNLPDSTRINLWFVLASMAEGKTDVKVFDGSTKEEIDFWFNPDRPTIKVNWKRIEPEGQLVRLVIPFTMGCPASDSNDLAHLQMIPTFVPDQIPGFWTRQIHILRPVTYRMYYPSR